MIERGAVHWVDLGAPSGHRPAERRPVLVVQSNAYNRSRLGTAIVAVLTSNTDLAVMPGNVFLPASATGLPKDSVVNVTALVTVDKSELSDPVGQIPDFLRTNVDRGLRRVLAI